ncbi:unnamed protein product [Rotaria sordida]|uniref:Uncharacterized protein n=1 Tax=Rotaria sordida TaxID=392033 RepID=A0A819PAB7_9BILA|nr:unnamed protein product [Rotaria sordida]
MIKNLGNHSNDSNNIRRRRSSSNGSSSDNNLKINKNLGNRSNGSNNIRRRRNLSNGSSLYNHHQMNCSPLKLRQYDRSSTEYCRAKVIRTRMIIGQPKHVPKHDILVVDRGFRDSVSVIQALGLDVAMPPFLDESDLSIVCALINHYQTPMATPKPEDSEVGQKIMKLLHQKNKI